MASIDTADSLAYIHQQKTKFESFVISHIVDSNVKNLYLHFEMYGYPNIEKRINLRNVNAFVAWADRVLVKSEDVLSFRDIFPKFFAIFQEQLRGKRHD